MTSGPDAGQTSSAVTDNTGKASFTYTDAGPGTDIVVASVPTAYTASPMKSNQTSVLWTNNPSQLWSGADIGNPTLTGSNSLSNGTWTVQAQGRISEELQINSTLSGRPWPLMEGSARKY